MSTPQPPDQWGRAWSENPSPEQDPPTQQFAAQGPYGDPAYSDPAYVDPAYPDPGHAAQSYAAQPYAAEHYYAPQYSEQQPPPPVYAQRPPSRTPGWAWALLVLVLVGLVGGLGYFAVTQLSGSDEPAAAATRPVTEQESRATTAPAQSTPRPTTPSARPSPTKAPSITVPSNALSCPTSARTGELSTSAVVGNTSCPFAEEVRMAYLQQPERDADVSVRAFSPMTKQWYTMSCTGSDVVKCTGGTDAAVYVY